MTANPRRPAFRLPWTDDGPAEPVEAATPTTDPPEEAAAAPSDEAAPAPVSPQNGATPPADEPSDESTEDAEEPPSDEFLHNLVAAMRGVAEESRDANLAELRRTVDVRIEQLRAAAAERVEELRRGSELDIAATGDWEKAEMDRVKAEAERRVAAQRAELERQLADHRASSEREIEATRRRLADYEVELTAFFTQLSEIRDPAAFVAAAKRMPRGPELLPTPPAAPAPSATAPASEGAPEAAGDVSMSDLAAQRASLVPTAEPVGDTPSSTGADASAGAEGEAAAAQPEVTNARLAERLAELDQRVAHEGSNGESAEPMPAASTTAAVPSTAATPAADTGDTAAPTAPSAPSGEETDGDQSTPIMVKGLGSFGAITSFKQALERADGIRGVTLSLGPGGEFVYRASHAPGFDLVAAIRAIEGQGADIDETDGSLMVTINRGR
jgi:hypothetical protein